MASGRRASPPPTRPDPAGELPPALEPLRKLFRRTWELELLISGVVVLALFQLPGRLAAGFDLLSVTLSADAVTFVWMGYVYLQLAVITIAAALLVHLLARAYWVGLIGLRSVFPRGVRWGRLETLGPRSKAFYRAALPSLSRSIERTDAFCSSIFSFAFAPAFVSLFGILMVMPMLVLAFAIDRLLFGGEHLTLVLMALAVVLVLPPTLLPLIDRRIARRPGGRGWLDRAVRAVLRPYYFAFGAPLYNPIVFTFQTNIRTRAFYGAFFAVFGLLLSGLLATHLWRQGNLVLGAGYLPLEGGADGMSPVHYRDQRPPDRIYRRPSIQSRVIEDRYLELFVPYVPRRHDDLVAERCPDLETRSGWMLVRGRDRFRQLASEERAGIDRALDCVSGLFSVELDGRALTDPPFLFSRDTTSGVGGLAAFLPVADLAPGRHLLTVRRVLSGEDEDRRPIEHVIPFWR